MKKILSHWSIAFVTLIVLTYIGLQDPWAKEILRLGSFDYVLQNEVKTPSESVSIVTIDEQAIEKYGQWPWKRDVLADLILNLRNAQTGIIVMPILFSEEDRMGGDDDDDDGSSAGYEINPILAGVFSGGTSGDIYYDYPPIEAAEGGIMDLQNGGESKGPGTGTSDSIPAMLSDGEFVMTAKAVRGAGGGDRREGARKMYQMMDNLERSA